MADLRRERWRHTHGRLAGKHVRSGGGDLMGRGRLKVAVYRGGQVLPGHAYRPQELDPADSRTLDLARFRPRIEAEQWDANADIVLDLVLRTPYTDRLRDKHWAGTLHRFLCWARRRGYSLWPPELLTGDRIDEFIAATYPHPTSATVHRSRLRSIAAYIFPAPHERTFVRIPPMAPHSAADIARFLAGAEELIAGHHARSTVRQALYRDVCAVLALTFGAGCHGKDVHRVRQGWVRTKHDGNLVLHRPDRALPLPIQAGWAALLAPSLTAGPDAWIVRPQSPHGRGEQVGKIFKRARTHAPQMEGFDTDRAARRWQVDLLEASQFDVLAALCGFRTGSQTAVDLVKHVPARPLNDATAIVEGWLA